MVPNCVGFFQLDVIKTVVIHLHLNDSTQIHIYMSPGVWICTHWIFAYDFGREIVLHGHLCGVRKVSG